jgi:hypothetical protein
LDKNCPRKERAFRLRLLKPERGAFINRSPIG